MSKQNLSGNTGIYMRLSRDDEKAGESMSIENQRIILRSYVAEHGGKVTDEYVDDGWSGTDFNRPAVKRLLEDAQNGKIDTIVVKDLSRFGRNYIQVGQYIDYIFPAYGIRFIALSDNVDTADRSSTAMDMMPIMNVFNEWHAANTSKKIRTVLEANQRSGKYTNWNYPYGYKAGTDENRTAVIDAEAAKVVRRIFDLRVQGKSCSMIARILTDEGIPNPATYFTKTDGGKSSRNCLPYWSVGTVRWILGNSTYIGNMTQHKTTSVSYKNHKVVSIPEHEWIIKENAHKAIIDRETWDKVQAINKSVSRGRADKTDKIHALSGLLICADCGKKLKFKNSGAYGCFVCRTYSDLGKKYCTSHIISEKRLETLILQDIKSMICDEPIDEVKARERFMAKTAKKTSQNQYSDEMQFKACKNRLSELNRLIQSAFEEKVLKNLPESVCADLCTKYQTEKEEVERDIAILDRRLSERKNRGNVAEYLEKLENYEKCEIFNREMCLQLIEYIIIGEKNKSDGARIIDVYYKFASNEKI